MSRENLESNVLTRRDFLKIASVTAFGHLTNEVWPVQPQELPRHFLNKEDVLTSLNGCFDLYSYFMEFLSDMPSGESLEDQIRRGALEKFLLGGFSFRFVPEEKTSICDYIKGFLSQTPWSSWTEEVKKVDDFINYNGLSGLWLYIDILQDLWGKFGENKVIGSDLIEAVLGQKESQIITVFDYSLDPLTDPKIISPYSYLNKSGQEETLFERFQVFSSDEEEVRKYLMRFINGLERNFEPVKSKILSNTRLPFTYFEGKGMMRA